MLLEGTEVLARAARRGVPVIGFSAYNMETVQGICAAGEQSGSPLLLQAGSSAFTYAGRDALARLALDAARSATSPVGVHLDHSRDLDELDACISLGYTSVMFDGSHLPFEENVGLTRTAVERAHAAGVWVEGELGAIAGDEDRSLSASAGEMTDPHMAAEFAERTGVDALAVAVGNVHGFAPPDARLDLEHLSLIARSCSAPLVLHGASGVPIDQLRAAAGIGVVKFNVNTELRRAHLQAVARGIDSAMDSFDLAGLMGLARDAVRDTAIGIITALSAVEDPSTDQEEMSGHD